MRHSLLPTLAALLLFPLAACTSDAGDDVGEDEGFYTSWTGTLQEVEFDGELLTDSWQDPKSAIYDQLLFTIGVLNGEGGVSRLDKYVLTNVTTAKVGDLKRVRYHIKLPVSIRKSKPLPAKYTMVLPKRV